MQYLRSRGSDNSELDPEKYCERGLESYRSKERHSEIDMKRKLHVIRVIHEQARQSVLGTKDPEQIRLMAESQSGSSLLRAQIRAALDQHEVQPVLSNGPAAKTPSLDEVEAALEMHKNYLFAHAQMLEEQQRQRKGNEEQVPIPSQEDTMAMEEDTPEFTTAGTVPFASLYSEKSIFNPDGRLENKVPSSFTQICEQLPNRLISNCEGGMGLRKISFGGIDGTTTSQPRSSAISDINQQRVSVTDFLRKARLDRQVQLSGVASRCSNVGMSTPSSMQLAHFGSSDMNSGAAFNAGSEMMLAGLSLRTNSDLTITATTRPHSSSSNHNTRFAIHPCNSKFPSLQEGGAVQDSLLLPSCDTNTRLCLSGLGAENSFRQHHPINFPPPPLGDCNPTPRSYRDTP
jgi:hypothetical protein